MQTHILTETRTEIIAFAENPKQTHTQSARMTGNMGALHTRTYRQRHAPGCPGFTGICINSKDSNRMITRYRLLWPERDFESLKGAGWSQGKTT